MSRLNDMLQGTGRYVVKRVGKIVAGAFIVGALAGIVACVKNTGEEVYRGNIDGYSVIYEEDRPAIRGESNFQINKMTARKENITYIFEDSIDETNIDWSNQQKPDFENDNLEKVVIRSGTSSKEYRNPWSSNDRKNKIDTSTLQGQTAQKVFDGANPLYNDLRARIREELRVDYEAEQKPSIDSFQK